jgi:hypothetical protein
MTSLEPLTEPEANDQPGHPLHRTLPQFFLHLNLKFMFGPQRGLKCLVYLLPWYTHASL